MLVPASPPSRMSKLRALATRLSWLVSALALLAAVALVLALFGLLPARSPERVASVAFDPAQASEPVRPLSEPSRALPIHRLLLWSFPLCAAPEQGARLYRLALQADRSTFALFCQGEYLLLDVEAAREPPRVTRLARFPLRGELPGGAAVIDLDGDATSDLVLGVAPREGIVHRPSAGLFWLRGRVQGGYEAARALVEMPTVSAAAVDLDGNGKSELAVLTRGDPAAQRPGELWIFQGGSSPARSAVVPLALAPADLVVTAGPSGEHALWTVSRQPGSLVRMRFSSAPESWAAAPREVVPLAGAEALLTDSLGRLYARSADQLFAVDAAATPLKLTPQLERGELGPATWIERGPERALLLAKPAAFALLAHGERVARVRSLPVGKRVLDVSSAGGGTAPMQGVLLVRGEEQPAELSLVVLPAAPREEASEIELRTGAVDAAPGEARVPLE